MLLGTFVAAGSDHWAGHCDFLDRPCPQAGASLVRGTLCAFILHQTPVSFRHPLHCGVLSCVSPHCLAATVECDPAQGKRVHVAQLQFCDSGYTGMNVRLLGVECCLSR